MERSTPGSCTPVGTRDYEQLSGAVLAIVLHSAGRYPDTAMSVVLGDPVPATAVAINLQQLRSHASRARPAAAWYPPRP
ncbi:hypothetical protein ACFQ1B_37475 [Streptomyces mexicanus]